MKVMACCTASGPGSRFRASLLALISIVLITVHSSSGSASSAISAGPPLTAGGSGGYVIGADVSFLAQAEADGTSFKDNGKTKPGLEIFRDHGYNWIRLRLFHTPTRLPNSLDYTIALATQAKKLGFKFLLDYHYSDTWADPGKQFLPKAWEGKSHAELVKAVFEYTRDTMVAFANAGAKPDMVQVGNEVTNGMLWPDGRLPGNWDQFADLVKAGIRGVRAGQGGAPGSPGSNVPLIMIHIDRGGDKEGTKAFFDRLNSYHVDFDVIGQSYYPRRHGGPASSPPRGRWTGPTRR